MSDNMNKLDILFELSENHNDNILFRGENKIFGHLIPSMYRRNGISLDHIFSDPDFLEHKVAIEGVILILLRKDFYKYSLENIDDSPYFVDMQHYGVPTPYIDWTEKLIIAILFALFPDPLKIKVDSIDFLEENLKERLKNSSFNGKENAVIYFTKITPANMEEYNIEISTSTSVPVLRQACILKKNGLIKEFTDRDSTRILPPICLSYKDYSSIPRIKKQYGSLILFHHAFTHNHNQYNPFMNREVFPKEVLKTFFFEKIKDNQIKKIIFEILNSSEDEEKKSSLNAGIKNRLDEILKNLSQSSSAREFLNLLPKSHNIHNDKKADLEQLSIVKGNLILTRFMTDVF